LLRSLGGGLPEPCAFIVNRRPMLVHPRSGIVFGELAWIQPAFVFAAG
jgi:hypothetical protein